MNNNQYDDDDEIIIKSNIRLVTGMFPSTWLIRKKNNTKSGKAKDNAEK